MVPRVEIRAVDLHSANRLLWVSGHLHLAGAQAARIVDGTTAAAQRQGNIAHRGNTSAKTIAPNLRE